MWNDDRKMKCKYCKKEMPNSDLLAKQTVIFCNDECYHDCFLNEIAYYLDHHNMYD